MKENNPDDFADLQMIIDMHANLVTNFKDLEADNKQLDDDVERQKIEIEKYLQMMEQQKLQINNEVATIKNDIEVVKAQVVKQRSEAEDAAARDRLKRQELSQITMAVSNIYYSVAGAQNKLTARSVIRQMTE